MRNKSMNKITFPRAFALSIDDKVGMKEVTSQEMYPLGQSGQV